MFSRENQGWSIFYWVTFVLQEIFQMCKRDATEHMDNMSRLLITPSTVKIKVKNMHALITCKK